MSVIVNNTAAPKDQVMTFAAMISGEFAAHLEAAADAKEVSQYAVVQVILDLEETFGEDTLKTWPVPGTEAPSNNPDKFTVRVKDGDQWKDRKTSFYTELVEGTEKGKFFRSKIEAVKQANSTSGVCDDKEVSAMKPEDRKALKAKYEQRLSVYKATVRKAVQHWQQCWEIDRLPLVSVTFLKDGVTDSNGKPVMVDGEQLTTIRKTPKPVKVHNANDLSDYELYSLGSFLSLDVDEALVNGGTFGALKATNRRDGNAGGDGDEANNVVVKDIVTFESAAAGLVLWLEQEGNIALLKARLTKKPLENSGFIDTLLLLTNELTANRDVFVTASQLAEAASKKKVA